MIDLQSQHKLGEQKRLHNTIYDLINKEMSSKDLMECADISRSTSYKMKRQKELRFLFALYMRCFVL
jgi:hypothetical protein